MSLALANVSAYCLFTFEKQTAAIDAPADFVTEVLFFEAMIFTLGFQPDGFSSNLYILL
jgi:hypothetical protein